MNVDKNPRILVQEENPHLKRAYELLAPQAGIEVTLTETAEECSTAFLKEPGRYSALIVSPTGLDALKTIRKNSPNIITYMFGNRALEFAGEEVAEVGEVNYRYKAELNFPNFLRDLKKEIQQ
jgi:hypothetical protein